MTRRLTICVALAALATTALAADPDLSPLQRKFMADLGRRAAAAEKAEAAAVAGRDGWLFLTSELRHVSVGSWWGDVAAQVSRAPNPDHADPLPAIVDFHEKLAAEGVELIFLPVPPKALVYPEKASGVVSAPEGEPPALDAAHQAFYERLRAGGVNVLDLGPLMRQARALDDEPLGCRTDSHWSGRACVLAAEALARQIKEKPWLKVAGKTETAAAWRDVEIAGDLPDLLAEGTPMPPKETLKLRFVTEKATGRPVEPDAASPVLLLGDSHTLVFHLGGDLHASGAGLADQLAAELGVAVDLIGTRGSGATPVRMTLARKAIRDPAYLEAKKLVIWCLSAREFTEAFQGWRILPVTK